MKDWISVKDRLPKNNLDVQVYCSDTEEQFVAFYTGEDGLFQHGMYRDSVTDIRLMCNPTYWMPLPEPPK